MFNRETLTKLHELTAENARLKEQTSDHLKAAQDQYGHRLVKLERRGKEIEVKEKVLWDEVFYLGVGSQAGDILRERHPKVFESFLEQDKIAAELKRFCVLEFGIDFQALTISDYLRMTESLFELLLEEHGIAQMAREEVPLSPNAEPGPHPIAYRDVPVRFKAPIRSPITPNDLKNETSA